MQITMYDTLIPTANRMLGSLSAILDKAAAFAEQKKIEPEVLLNARLAPDMFGLTKQVQIACDLAVRGAMRLSAGEIPTFEDNETSFAQLKARIANALTVVNSANAAQFNGSEDRDVTLKMRSGEMHFKGLDFLRDFVLPNLYFHITTAYAILRHNGVELGKKDFLGA
ncbi:MAG TPA: DUF1993 domain-containing protein [Rudaea sp.]|nr:DUF1993 domain-containing protein [Rudaea sp.]